MKRQSGKILQRIAALTLGVLLTLGHAASERMAVAAPNWYRNQLCCRRGHLAKVRLHINADAIGPLCCRRKCHAPEHLHKHDDRCC